MNVAPANTPRYATELTELEECVVRTIRNTRRETIEMKQLDAINMRIASVQTIDALKAKGLIYQGTDDELHVTEQRKSTTNLADQSRISDATNKSRVIY